VKTSRTKATTPTTTTTISAAAVIVATIASTAAHAQTITNAGLAKGILQIQTDETTLVSPNGNLAFGFDADVNGADLDLLQTAPVIDGPITLAEPFNNNGVLGLSPSNDSFSYGFPNFDGWSTTSKAELDTLFPNGNYTFTIPGASQQLPLTLTGDLYANQPVILLTGGEWQGGVYILESDTQLTVTTTEAHNLFGNNTVDAAIINIEGPDGTFFEDEDISFDGGDGIANITIPANTLTPGLDYEVDAEFASASDIATSLPPLDNFTAFAFYTAFTTATLRVTTPTPDCTADTNNDQTVGLDDLLTVLANFGSTTPNGPADGDIDPPGAPDGTVGLGDLLLVLANFGNTCP